MNKFISYTGIKTFAVLLLVVFAPTASLRSEIFSHAPRILKEGEKTTLRGVINDLTMPVPDSFETGATQSGYFLIVPFECTIQGEDVEGEVVVIHAQKMFHLTPSEEQQKLFEKVKGKPVEVTLTLGMAHTRYHRTPVLMNVESLKLLTPKE